MQYIESIVVPNEPSRRVDVIYIKIRRIGAAIPVEVFQANDRSTFQFPIERSVFIARYKDGTVGCSSHENRIIHRRWVGEQGGLETLG